MSADLHIHIRTPELTDELVASFFSSTIDSKYYGYSRDRKATLQDIKNHPHWKWLEKDFDPQTGELLPGKYGHDLAYIVVADTPNIWVGEVSWLKAALFDNAAVYIPNTIERISEILSAEDGQPITEEVIAEMKAAFELPNETGYSLAKADEVIGFLQEHLGEKAFTVSW